MEMELEYVRDCIWSFWAMFNVTATNTGCLQNLACNCVLTKYQEFKELRY